MRTARREIVTDYVSTSHRIIILHITAGVVARISQCAAGDGPYRHAQHPETSVVPQRFRRIEQERDHEYGQDERVDVRRYVQRLAVQEYQRRAGPHQPENGGQLHDVLLGEVVPGVQLEDEHVVDAGRAPAVHVDAHEKQKYDQQQRAPVKPDHDPPVGVLVPVSDACTVALHYT